MTSDENNNLRYFIQDYGISEINRKEEQYRTPESYDTFSNYFNNYTYVIHATRIKYSMEIEEEKFLNIVHKVTEYDNLMKDPETAKLVMEAKFISRLKGRF